MRKTPERQALFDSHVEDYQAQCMHGLRLSGESVEFFARGRLACLRAWWDRSGRAEPDTIVDYGCGTGDNTAVLPEFFPRSRVIGADPSAPCVEHATRVHASDGLSFVTTAELDSDAAGRADLVHVNGVLHHVDPPRRGEFHDSCARLVAPDGVVALFENNPLNPGTRLVMARILFDRGAVPVPPWEARRGLADAGLRGVETRYLFFFPGFLRALRPLERLLSRVPFGAQYGIVAVRADP